MGRNVSHHFYGPKLSPNEKVYYDHEVLLPPLRLQRLKGSATKGEATAAAAAAAVLAAAGTDRTASAAFRVSVVFAPPDEVSQRMLPGDDFPKASTICPKMMVMITCDMPLASDAMIVTSGVLCRRQDVPPLGLLSEARAKGSLWILLHDAAAVHGVPAFQEMVMVLAFRFLAPISISSWREDEEGGGDAGIMLLISGPSIVDSPPQNNLDGRVSNFVQHYELQSGCVT
uniref:Uncharacterized protein n=1 Tax=Oryza barthii TaxID=65489 RepID=A0A0D3GAF6_9ORYZ